MSRLDDELKLVFQRQEPSEDFAERVLARIRVDHKPKAGFWQTLVSFFQPVAFRWAVAATAIVLAAVIGFIQYQRLHQNAVDTRQAGVSQIEPNENPVVKAQLMPQENPQSGGITKPEPKRAGGDNHKSDIQPVGQQKSNPRLHPKLKYVKHSSVKPEEAVAKDARRKSEGEIAKEQLMRALFIASATVNEAKKLAIGGTD
jgi:hypothetical protein